MGARFFTTEATGTSPKQAYQNAVMDAIIEHGTEPYSGTIKETESFIITNTEPDPEHPDIQDKWGPCACTCIGNGHYLFWGWASD
ncbi:hypothetical protein KKF84_01895 [Myxococcota bacterium]|nr:hypothetical protein [Myxococcota bacterium]